MADYGMNPHLKRWMLFVDGENFAMRGQAVAEREGVVLQPGEFFSRDEFLWMPDHNPLRDFPYYFLAARVGLQVTAVRAHYYTSIVGDEERITGTKRALRSIGFQPEVYKKTRRDQKAKGVDIALVRDVLSHAYRGNYDVAVLMAGDGDYIPLIEEVKREGQIVYVSFFTGDGSGMNPELQLSADTFIDVNRDFLRHWRRHLQSLQAAKDETSAVQS